ncbi:MAG: polyprenyl synthetase family protein [Firmicutes bacterium]|nr:polyprenyl synthetase family protein [Bacillota bacterium]
MLPEIQRGEAYLRESTQRLDPALHHWIETLEDTPQHLREAMAYTLYAGGKRFRPALLFAACEACGGDPRQTLPAACAIEVLHTYSLIHDDLPAMDNDDLRRGRPSNHKVFGEATALLAGDALLTAAFFLMTTTIEGYTLPSTIAAQAVHMLAKAAGAEGMVGGQEADIEATAKRYIGIEEVHYIHRNKTAALIAASVRIGGLIGGASPAQQDALQRFGEEIGLAFQIQDDVLDEIGETKQLGKAAGRDAALGKATYPAIVGLEKSQQTYRRLYENACAHLKTLPEPTALKALVAFAQARSY